MHRYRMLADHRADCISGYGPKPNLPRGSNPVR